MKRREFIKLSLVSASTAGIFGLVGCGQESGTGRENFQLHATSDGERVVLYDTYMMALYMDGGLGPKTGIMKVDYVLKNEPVTLKFWHGHGGKDHYFTLLPEHFAALKKLTKVTITTTVVDSHTHKLFIDPKDPKWRVPGAVGVEVPELS